MLLIKVVCGASYDCECEILAISYPAYGGGPFSRLRNGNRIPLIWESGRYDTGRDLLQVGCHGVENMLEEVQNERSPGH